MILAIRTDNPIAEVGLYDGQTKLAYKTWQAHRELSITIHVTIKDLLESQAKSWKAISGIVYFKGPGSFTGLRIGASVVNALAVVNNIPITNQNGESWVANGIEALLDNQFDPAALPEYGSEPHTSAPKKSTL